MEDSKEQIRRILIKKEKELLKQPRQKNEFTGVLKADDLLNNIKTFSHAFVLASIMDRQIKAERAWIIPYLISEELGGFQFSKLLKIDLKQFKKIFKKHNLHRFNDVMAKNFYLGIQRIHSQYDSNAVNIWSNNPASATVVRRFLEFEGVGIKIATMATNILVRDFKVPMKEYACIDISPDIQVKKVFIRLGFLTEGASNDELIYRARELNPNYPGVFDLSCWEIGRNWCRPNSPDCNSCYLKQYCPTGKSIMKNMSRYLLVVSCSATKDKLKKKLPAIKRYNGVNYKIIKKLMREGDSPKNLDIVIISAKYGFLESDDLIDDYEKKMDKNRAKVLNKQIISDFKEYLKDKKYSGIFFNLGEDYMEAIDGFREFLPKTTKVDFAKGGIGQKMKHMKKWIMAL